MRLQPQIPTYQTELRRLQEECRELRKSILAPLTLSGYAYDWGAFQRWCTQYARESLPASTETVSLYLTAILLAGKKVTTAKRRSCAIAHYHRQAGVTCPVGKEIRELLICAQRQRGEQPRRMTPRSIDQLRRISIALREKGGKLALRDRAILVIGFASALRSNNIAALTMRDVERTSEGYVLHVRREKQDQQGKGRCIGLPRGECPDTCPVRCLDDWRAIRDPRHQPVFPRLSRGTGKMLDNECICRIVKRAVQLIGLNPEDGYGGHSLRAGFVTAAGEAGVNELLIAAQTGHRSLHTLSIYFRRTNLFRSNACALLGL